MRKIRLVIAALFAMLSVLFLGGNAYASTTLTPVPCPWTPAVAGSTCYDIAAGTFGIPDTGRYECDNYTAAHGLIANAPGDCGYGATPTNGTASQRSILTLYNGASTATGTAYSTGGTTGGGTTGGTASSDPLNGAGIKLVSDQVDIFRNIIIPAVAIMIIAVYAFTTILKLATRFMNRA